MKPLVRILLRHGIPFRAFAEYAKRAYVDVAGSEFAVPGRKSSISRISVITGLTRKDVARLTPRAEQSPVDLERYHRAARVVTGWIRDKEFADKRGQPANLPFEGEKGSFSELVRRYSGDVPARAVLDELRRVEAVEELKGGRFRLLTRGYVPRAGEEEKIGILGRDVADLISTIDHNLTEPPEDAFFQRNVSYDNLPAESIPGLRGRVGKKAQALLEYLDGVMSQSDRDTNPKAEGTGRKRAVLGIYYYEDDADEEH